MNTCLFSSLKCDWSTPQDLFDSLNNEFSFTLDPCASPENAKCKKYFTVADNGLLMSWQNEVVFCNPPYGRDIRFWISKAYCESIIKKHCTVVLLLPARTDTRWFHELIYPYAEIRFVLGRLRFGGSSCNAPFPSMICVFRGK